MRTRFTLWLQLLVVACLLAELSSAYTVWCGKDPFVCGVDNSQLKDGNCDCPDCADEGDWTCDSCAGGCPDCGQTTGLTCAGQPTTSVPSKHGTGEPEPLEDDMPLEEDTIPGTGECHA